MATTGSDKRVIVTGGAGTASTTHGTLGIKSGDTFAVFGGTAPTTISGDVEVIVAAPGLA